MDPHGLSTLPQWIFFLERSDAWKLIRKNTWKTFGNVGQKQRTKNNTWNTKLDNIGNGIQAIPHVEIEISNLWGNNQDTMCGNYQWHIGWNLWRIHQNWKCLLLGQESRMIWVKVFTSCWNTISCKMLELVLQTMLISIIVETLHLAKKKQKTSNFRESWLVFISFLDVHVGNLILLMAEIRLTTWDVWNPINNGKNYLSTG